VKGKEKRGKGTRLKINVKNVSKGAKLKAKGCMVMSKNRHMYMEEVLKKILFG
jgi:hypothetical protein